MQVPFPAKGNKGSSCSCEKILCPACFHPLRRLPLLRALSLAFQPRGRPAHRPPGAGGRWPCSSSRVLSCSIQCLQLCDEPPTRLSVSSSSLERETPTSPHLLLLLCSAVFNTFSDLILEQNLLLPFVRNYLPFFSFEKSKRLRFNQIYNKIIVFMLIDKYYILY